MFNRKLSAYALTCMLATFIICLLITSFAFSKTLQWRMGTTWTPAIDLIEADRHFVKMVNDTKSLDLKIKLYSSGELVPAFELFDAVSRGTLQAGGDWPNYWSGKNRAFDALGSYPMGLTAIDYATWIYQYGGLKKYQMVYGKYGLYYLPYAVTPMESGVRGHEPIKSLKDYKGLKIRMAGKAQGELLEMLGASQTMLSGGEIYQALEKGVIDAGEFSSPSNDWKMGFNEVTEYWATPGWHQPASVLGVMINMDTWKNLTEDQQNMLKQIAMANFLWSYTYYQKGAAEATKNFMETGTTITRLSDEDLAEIQDMVNELTIETAKKNPLFAEIIYDQYKYLNHFSKWREISQPFTFGRNVKMPDMKKLKKAANQ